ncbi:MAG: cobaltochelatase subunit CobN, partial [Colwellia sp.]|nr:cobaltochelatase subunit CobN [Colwellia sp.]
MKKTYSLFFLLLTTFLTFISYAENSYTKNTTVSTTANTTANKKAQNKPKVLIMMSSHVSKPKGELLAELAKNQPFELVNINSQGKSEDEIKAQWQSSKLILLDGINPALSKSMFEKFEPYLKKFPNIAIISLGDLNNKKINQGLTTTQQTKLGQYYNNAGRHNYANMMSFISHKILTNNNNITIEEPMIMPTTGLYHDKFKNKLTKNENEFFTWLAPTATTPVIAIGIYRSVVDYEQQQVVNALIQGLEDKGAKAFGFYFDDAANDDYSYTDLLIDEQGNSRVNLLINYRSLHYIKKRRGEFEKIGVPVLHALNYTDGDEQAFEQDHTGVSPSLTPFFLVMPEDTGSTDPTIIAAEKNGEKVIMQAQLNALVERAYNHAKLAITPNKNKRVATFIWNYPPGEKNIGAAFLDVPSSIEQIANAMKAQGYTVDVKSSEAII